jgi:hypothetical protein
MVTLKHCYCCVLAVIVLAREKIIGKVIAMTTSWLDILSKTSQKEPHR